MLGVLFFAVSVKHHPGEGTSLLFEGIVKRGLQFPGAHHPSNVIKITGKGIQDIFFCITKAVA